MPNYIRIDLKLTDAEHDLLVAGKCDKPHPDRIKALLIQEAKRNLTMLINDVDKQRHAKFFEKNKVEPDLNALRDKVKRDRVRKGGAMYISEKALTEGYEAIGRLRAAVNRSYQEGRRTREERDDALIRLDKRQAELKAKAKPTVLKLATKYRRKQKIVADMKAGKVDPEVALQLMNGIDRGQ